VPMPEPTTNGAPKIGVYVCHCGVNIAAKVNVAEVVEFAKTLPFVTVAREYKFMCSDPGQELIQQDLREGKINRVVVASCSPLMHEATFRRATAEGGQNPFFFHMANIREHVSWVTADERITPPRRRRRSSRRRCAVSRFTSPWRRSASPFTRTS
jgi:heterodisulfide reductase subunit A